MRLEEIRAAEAASHTSAYSRLKLYAPGSWLSKPVKALSGLLEAMDGPVACLDLGSGVGRNAIAVAKTLPGSTITCVDILPMAVEQLRENAEAHGVGECIRGILSPVDGYHIDREAYDLILAASVLEHLDSRSACEQKIAQIANGIRPGGGVLVVMNTGVREWDGATGEALPPQFEVNLPPREAMALLDAAFGNWEILHRATVPYRYSVPRGARTAVIEAQVITYTARRPHV